MCQGISGRGAYSIRRRRLIWLLKVRYFRQDIERGGKEGEGEGRGGGGAGEDGKVFLGEQVGGKRDKGSFRWSLGIKFSLVMA